jgi:hypothetical protein
MLNFVQFINTNADLTANQKTAWLDDFCEERKRIPDPDPKEEFANEKINGYIEKEVNRVRRRKAELNAEYEKLVLNAA